ncbi:MAG: hypothetical protein AAB534_03590 [Patescibacteria group bacterium]
MCTKTVDIAFNRTKVDNGLECEAGWLDNRLSEGGGLSRGIVYPSSAGMLVHFGVRRE